MDPARYHEGFGVKRWGKTASIFPALKLRAFTLGP
jgi:hypothetical protein